MTPHSTCSRVCLADTTGVAMYGSGGDGGWGGGGWGDPFARDPELVKIDVDRGLVTSEGARRYGVVIASNGAVDSDATAELRAQLQGSRTDIPLFNRGGTVEELRSRCEAETHMRAPVAPTF